MPNPVAGNQNFTKLDNTIVSGSVVNAANKSGKLSQIKQVEGTFTPTATGSYAVEDENGNTILLPPNSLVLHVIMSSDVTLTSAGAPTFTAVLSATDGGGAGTALTGAVALASVNSGENPAVIATTGVTDVYLSGTVAVAAVTAGTARVRVLYMETVPV